MRNKPRFLLKNKHSFIALLVLLAVVFNACENPATGKPEGNTEGKPEEGKNEELGIRSEE